MDKVHIRNLFRVFVPLEGRPRTALPTTDPFGLDFTSKQVNLRLVCTDCFGNIKDEAKDCFTWAKRNIVIFPKDEDENHNVNGMFMRLKINQGVFDFRKTKERLFRIIVELHEGGSVTRMGMSTILELFPKKRYVETDNEGSEVVVPIHWVGEDGYLVDNQQDISPEEDSPLSTNSVNPIANPFTESDSVRDLNFDDAILDDMDSNRFSMVPSSVVYQTPSNDINSNENYMVLYNGNAEVVGNFRALNFYKASDINIKEDIRLLEEDRDCRASLLKINGVEYKFKQGVSHSTNKRFIGYIAQQIESVVPEAVQLIDGILHVDYESLIPYLSEAVKQNYGDIKNVTSEVDSVKQALDALYVQFTGVNSQKDGMVMRRRSSTVRHIFGWIAGVIAVSALLALTIVFLFFTPQHQPSPVPEHASPTISPANTDNERSMLSELFNFLLPDKDFSPSLNFTGPHCSWHGIACNETTGRVIAINLPGFSLNAPESSSFPESLGNFTELQVLDLSNNLLFGTFPEPIVRLKNLVSLKLQVNKLTGFIPDLHNLSKLQILWLSSNQLQGPFDMLMQLPALESLTLQHNLLSSKLPQNISKSLLQLDVNHCDLYGTIPESWASSSLTSIDLSVNKLNGSVPCFGPDLIRLVARYNKLDGQFCGQSLRSIQELDISGNKLTGTFDLPGVNVTNMTLLIQNNRFTSFMPSSSNLTLAPALCSANYNEFKCPIPAWSAEKCQADCWPPVPQ